MNLILFTFSDELDNVKALEELGFKDNTQHFVGNFFSELKVYTNNYQKDIHELFNTLRRIPWVTSITLVFQQDGVKKIDVWKID